MLAAETSGFAADIVAFREQGWGQRADRWVSGGPIPSSDVSRRLAIVAHRATLDSDPTMTPPRRRSSCPLNGTLRPMVLPAVMRFVELQRTKPKTVFSPPCYAPATCGGSVAVALLEVW